MAILILTLPSVVGQYMLMDSSMAVPGAKSEIKSPSQNPSSGCLELTFHYSLYGTSTTMELSVHTITTGTRLHLQEHSQRDFFFWLKFASSVYQMEALDLLSSLSEGTRVKAGSLQKSAIWEILTFR